MSTIIDGVTVADPIVPTKISYVFIGEYSTAIDGSVLVDSTASRKKWTLEWKHLTQSEYDTLMAKLTVTGEQTFSPPEDSGTYNVIVRQDTLSIDATIIDNVQYYDISVDIEEAA